jgi:hypothetical protein
MPIATLYKATGEVEEIETSDYFTSKPGIAHGAPQGQLGRDHIAKLIGALDGNHVDFCESHDGRRIAYALPIPNQPLNPYVAAHCILPIHGDVVEIDYDNSLDD